MRIRSSVVISISFMVGLMFCAGNNAIAADKQKATAIDSAYIDLRDMALHTTPLDLELSMPADKAIVYGVVLDWEIDGRVATISAYSTGDANYYLSTGGGVTGGGKHEPIHKAAERLVTDAQQYLDKAIRASSTPLPGKDSVCFYLLTNKGIYRAAESLSNFENGSSAWLPLFKEGNIVLTELREWGER